jgi:hypothetical protein
VAAIATSGLDDGDADHASLSSSSQPLTQRPIRAARCLPAAANHRLGGQLRVSAPAQERRALAIKRKASEPAGKTRCSSSGDSSVVAVMGKRVTRTGDS